MSKLTINTRQRRFPVAPNLYGLFYEDINRGGDNGMYPELLRNRAFEDSLPPEGCTVYDEGRSIVTRFGWKDRFNNGEGLDRWVADTGIDPTPVPAWYADHAQMQVVTADTLNPNRLAALDVDFGTGGSIANIGFHGIGQKPGETYAFYCFAKSLGGRELQVSIEYSDGTATPAQSLTIGADYARHDLQFTALKLDGKARLRIAGSGAFRIGFTSLTPTKTFRGHGLRDDIASLLSGMHPTFMRFPGGCVVEGMTYETAFRFQNTIGPQWERKSVMLMWHYRTYNSFGFHECLQFCEDIGMEPVYVCNCGLACQARFANDPFDEVGIQEMLDDVIGAIEYATAPADTKWGRLRAEAGHPAPFRMNYIEIGNENHGDIYESLYIRFQRELSQRFPWIQFISNHKMQRAEAHCDLIDEHYYNEAATFAQQTTHYDSYDRSGSKIFIGEFAANGSTSANLAGALGETMFMTGIERNQDMVRMTAYAPLLQNGPYYGWFPNLITFDSLHAYAIPAYYGWKLFGGHRGDYVVDYAYDTGIEYVSMKGMPSLIGHAGTTFRNPTWNGEPVAPGRQLLGYAKLEDGVYHTVPGDDLQIEQGMKQMPGIHERLLIVFGDDETAADGTFEAEFLAEEGKELSLGIYSAMQTKNVYRHDETAPERDWGFEQVRPLVWELRDGVSRIGQRGFLRFTDYAPQAEVALEPGQWVALKCVTQKEKIFLYVNGQLVQTATLPSYPSSTASVTDTDSQVIVKLVNFCPDEDEVAIRLDCDVDSAYTRHLVTGDPQDRNSLDEPEHIHDTTAQLTGAAREFVYRAPAWSINVLVLNKR